MFLPRAYTYVKPGRGAIVPFWQRQSLCSIPIACFAHDAFPQEMHHAQNMQKNFPVAEGDHAQGKLEVDVKTQILPIW